MEQGRNVAMCRQRSISARLSSDSMHGTIHNVSKFKIQLLRHIPAWDTHQSDRRSRLTAKLRTWATIVPNGVCACDAQCCREKKHVLPGPSIPTLVDPSVAAWCFFLSIIALCGAHFGAIILAHVSKHSSTLFRMRFLDFAQILSALSHLL